MLHDRYWGDKSSMGGGPDIPSVQYANIVPARVADVPVRSVMLSHTESCLAQRAQGLLRTGWDRLIGASFASTVADADYVKDLTHIRRWWGLSDLAAGTSCTLITKWDDDGARCPPTWWLVCSSATACLCAMYTRAPDIQSRCPAGDLVNVIALMAAFPQQTEPAAYCWVSGLRTCKFSMHRALGSCQLASFWDMPCPAMLHRQVQSSPHWQRRMSS